MIVAEEHVPLMLQYARWYMIDTEAHLAKLPGCACEKLKAQDSRYGACGRCHTEQQLARAEQFLSAYGGDDEA